MSFGFSLTCVFVVLWAFGVNRREQRLRIRGIPEPGLRPARPLAARRQNVRGPGAGLRLARPVHRHAGRPPLEAALRRRPARRIPRHGPIPQALFSSGQPALLPGKRVYIFFPCLYSSCNSISRDLSALDGHVTEPLRAFVLSIGDLPCVAET